MTDTSEYDKGIAGIRRDIVEVSLRKWFTEHYKVSNMIEALKGNPNPFAEENSTGLDIGQQVQVDANVEVIMGWIDAAS